MDSKAIQNTENVENLITRFYYRDNHLCFQILLQRGEERSLYKEYSDYSAYKKAYTELIEKKNSNQGISMPISNMSQSYIN